MTNSHDDPSLARETSSARETSGLGKTNGLRKTIGPDDRSAAAKAAAWASRIMTISLEMVVPGLVGYWLDTKLGTKFVLMLVGFVLGFTAAIKHLLHLTQKNAMQEKPNPKKD